jgi:hypothetical protein
MNSMKGARHVEPYVVPLDFFGEVEKAKPINTSWNGK